MPRYAPLPSVSIDPRNETNLVQQAAQVVYEASNRTLNDFSAGNPLAVLLEGQAFAQGELLFWANQLPDKILLEWIGPFLGAMRRLGTPAVAQVFVTINPQTAATFIPSGTSFTTNSQLSGGQSYEFISYEDITIPAGETVGKIPVYSKFVGNAYNVPANSITGSSGLNQIAISVTNPKAAVGGSEVETYQQVRERFFTLIRRRNLVSETDWQDFFTDLYGVGTITSVQPNRSSKFAYNYDNDYVRPNGQVSFFVLGPNGTELTDIQLTNGQNAINFLVPIENQGHLYPITLSEVQYNLTLEVNPNGSYGSDFRQSSLNFRNILFQVLVPGTTFPVTINPTVSDIDAAFYSYFTSDLRFIDPRIISSSAYNTPNSLGINSATYSKIYDFIPSNFLINQYDLIRVDSPNPAFYPALTDFTPYSADKFDQTVYGNLQLKQIKNLSAGSFELGDIVYYDGSANLSQKGLHVVLENITIPDSSSLLQYITAGKISDVKTYSPWSVGNSYVYSDGDTIDPDIVEFIYENGDFIPATPSNVPLNNRPGALVWLVSNNFTLSPPTNNVTGAQASFKLGIATVPQELIPETSYSAGIWVYTPQVGSGPNQEIDSNYYYVDITKGVVLKYAYVVSSFTYNPGTEKVSDYFDRLVEEGVLKEVVAFDGNNGLPIYKYKPRFKVGQYLEYRDSSNSEPNYYIASQFFTPDSANIQELIDKDVVISLTPTPELKSQFSSELPKGFSGQLGKLTISYAGEGYVDGAYTNVPLLGGDGISGTANITVYEGSISFIVANNRGQEYRVGDILTVDNSDLGGTGIDLQISVSSIYPPTENPLTIPTRMFTFFKGDTTFFRNGSEVRQYVATSSVTPIFDFEVYYNNKVFIESAEFDFNSSYEYSVPYNNPDYANYAEDIIVDDNGSSFYRVMRAFSPLANVTGFNGLTQANSSRYEEYAGNLLKIVTGYVCEEPVLPQFGQETSSIKLGNCQITIVPKSSNIVNESKQNLVYIWENTESSLETPVLSWYSGTPSNLTPPKYGENTLAL